MNLYIVSLFIFIIGTIILYSYTKNVLLSTTVVFAKVIIFYIYFSSGELVYTLLDDLQYFNGSIVIYNNLNEMELLGQLFNQAQGIHILYYIHNIFSIFIFGQNYYSPVALNIILTFLSALTLYKICMSLLISKRNSLFISILFCLHWDILSWSSFLNLKDILVQFLLLLAVYIYLENKGNLKIMLFKLLPVLGMIYFVRFYLIFFVLLAIFLARQKITKVYVFKSIFISLIFLVIVFAYDRNIFNIFLSQVDFDLILNIFRFLLTPIPFNYEDGYNFLVFSALLNWLTFPFVIIGFFLLLYKKENKYNFIIILNLLLILFYAGFDELLGPRQRFMLVPYFTIVTFFGFQYLYKIIYFKEVKYENSNIN